MFFSLVFLLRKLPHASVLGKPAFSSLASCSMGIYLFVDNETLTPEAFGWEAGVSIVFMVFSLITVMIYFVVLTILIRHRKSADLAGSFFRICTYLGIVDLISLLVNYIGEMQIEPLNFRRHSYRLGHSHAARPFNGNFLWTGLPRPCLVHSSRARIHLADYCAQSSHGHSQTDCSHEGPSMSFARCRNCRFGVTTE